MPTWTPEEFADYQRRTNQLNERLSDFAYADDQDHSSAPQSPQPECPAGDGAGGKIPGEKSNPGRISVSVKSFRRRLCDPDNLVPKYFIDCLRYAGWIPNDTAKDIQLTVEQEKVGRLEDERTEITVTYP